MPGVSNCVKINPMSLKNRFKILFGNAILVKLSMATERDPGKVVESEAEIWIGASSLLDKTQEVFDGHPMKR